MAVNKAIIVGNLGKDPEVRHTQNGTAVCNFSVATTEKYKDNQGQQQEQTEWHNIVVWGNLADICSKYLHKGKQVYLEGKIQTRKWQDKEGNDKYTTEIVAFSMQMLGNAGDGGQKQKHHQPAPAQNQEPGFDDPSMQIPF